MAESSIFWTTGATGDGASPYTQTQLFKWLRSILIGADSGNEGVLAGYLNELAVTTAGTTKVTVDTGSAAVYGIPYFNSAAVDVNIPTPASATRIDRIVLRASWAAQTIRITRIAGTEGAGAPSMTQTPDTTYDIPLAQASITTGGAITVTDNREYAHFSSKIDINRLDVAIGVDGEKLVADSGASGGMDWYPFDGASYKPTDGSLTVPNNSATIINFGTSIFDPNSRVTTGASWKFTAGKTGYYLISTQVTFSSSADWNGTTEYFQISIKKNGSTTGRHTSIIVPVTSQVSNPNKLTELMSLSAGDYIQIEAYQNSGVTQNINYSPGSDTFVDIARIF